MAIFKPMIVHHAGISNILVIKLRAIGDVLLSTVVLKSLRAAYPSARIDFLTERPAREVLEDNPDISATVIFDPTVDSGPGLILSVRRRRYDLVIDLFGNPRSALITRLSGARYRVGYRFSWRQYCYNIVAEPRGGEVHNTEFNLDALRALGIPVVASLPQFPLSGDGERFAEALFAREGMTGKAIVALNPGGGWYTKRWPVEQFAHLGRMMSAGIRSVIIWGPGERGEAERIRTLIGGDALLIPETNLKQLASILKRCSLLVTNDSGPMHIAAAVGTPVVAIFGPTNPNLQGPVGDQHAIVRNEGLRCLGCNYTRCPIGNPCMVELSAERVVESVELVRGETRALKRSPQP
jgi:lipopolysaccharide heptosyltransferase II